MKSDVISIISLCITLILAIAGFIVNTYLERKNHSIQIITTKRLERRQRAQELTAVMLLKSDADYLRILDKKQKGEAYAEFLEAMYQFKVLFEMSCKNDVELLDCVSRLRDSMEQYIEASGDSVEELEKCRAEFSKESDLYVASEWQRIKIETVGKNKRGRKSFEEWQMLKEKASIGFDDECNNRMIAGQ